MRRVSAWDYCGCTDELGARQHYETCQRHGETPYDRGQRDGRLNVYGAIIPTALVAALCGFVLPADAGTSWIAAPIGWTIIAVSFIVLIVTLIAQASDSRPRYRP